MKYGIDVYSRAQKIIFNAYVIYFFNAIFECREGKTKARHKDKSKSVTKKFYAGGGYPSTFPG
jgi:hypothetical protein